MSGRGWLARFLGPSVEQPTQFRPAEPGTVPGLPGPNGEDLRAEAVIDALRAGRRAVGCVLMDQMDMVTALVGPKRDGTFSVVLHNFPALEAQGGASGPFATIEEAEAAVRDLADAYDVPLSIRRVPNIDDLTGTIDDVMDLPFDDPTDD